MVKGKNGVRRRAAKRENEPFVKLLKMNKKIITNL